MQISLPRGRKSRPTRDSRTLDLPLLWLPTTATWGSSMVDWLPSWAKMSWSLLTMGITEWPSGGAGDREGDGDAGSSAIGGGASGRGRGEGRSAARGFGAQCWCEKGSTSRARERTQRKRASVVAVI